MNAVRNVRFVGVPSSSFHESRSISYTTIDEGSTRPFLEDTPNPPTANMLLLLAARAALHRGEGKLARRFHLLSALVNLSTTSTISGKLPFFDLPSMPPTAYIVAGLPSSEATAIPLTPERGCVRGGANAHVPLPTSKVSTIAVSTHLGSSNDGDDEDGDDDDEEEEDGETGVDERGDSAAMIPPKQ